METRSQPFWTATPNFDICMAEWLLLSNWLLCRRKLRYRWRLPAWLNFNHFQCWWKNDKIRELRPGRNSQEKRLSHSCTNGLWLCLLKCQGWVWSFKPDDWIHKSSQYSQHKAGLLNSKWLCKGYSWGKYHLACKIWRCDAIFRRQQWFLDRILHFKTRSQKIN